MLNVSNLEVSSEFYRSALGFEVVSPEKALRESRWAVIRSGDTELVLSETDTEIRLRKGGASNSNISCPMIFCFYPDVV